MHLNHLLTCISCNEKQEFATCLLNHLLASDKCYQRLKTNNNSQFVDLMAILSIPASANNVSITCEICGIVSTTAIGYMFHKDHHNLPLMNGEQPVLECKT